MIPIGCLSQSGRSHEISKGLLNHLQHQTQQRRQIWSDKHAEQNVVTTATHADRLAMSGRTNPDFTACKRHCSLSDLFEKPI